LPQSSAWSRLGLAGASTPGTKEGLVDKGEGGISIRLLQSSVVLLGKHPGSDPSLPPQGESHLEKPRSNLSSAVDPRHSLMSHIDEVQRFDQSADATPK
jgi:hypothetical protein